MVTVEKAVMAMTTVRFMSAIQVLIIRCGSKKCVIKDDRDLQEMWAHALGE